MLKYLLALLCSAAALASPAPAAAQPQDPHAVQAAALQPGERIVLDGTLAHPAWARAPVYSQFLEKQPRMGAAPSHRTEMRVLYDARALYVGVNALDPAPAQIRAPLVRHDSVNRTQDFVALYLDAVGTRQAAQFFRVNAAGSTADGVHTHADDSEDFAPDFDFDAAATRHAGGWSAVLRIPFSSLRYAQASDKPWRILLVRRVPREQFTMITSVPIPRELPSFIASMQPLLGVQPPRAHGSLQLRPSLTLRQERQRDNSGAQQRGDTQASLDLKWRPRAELVVDATFNPDFSQVALDVPQLRGNTAFALELSEKRPFFFEGSDLLRSPSGGLYTRSFQAPRLGLRATWRDERLAGTAIGVDDRGGGLTLLPGPYGTGVAEQPESRTLALRLRADAGTLQWGATAVQRSYRSDHGGALGHNRVAGPDLAWQLSDHWRLRAQWLGADTSALPQSAGLGPGTPQRGQRRYAMLTRQADGLQTDITVDDLSAGFRHDTGFVAQNGVRIVSAHQGVGWFDVKPLNELWFNLDAQQVRQAGSGTVVSEYLTPGLWMSGPHNLEFEVQWRGYSRQRASAAAPLLAERYLRLYGVLSPAPWLPFAETTLNLGRLADLHAGQVRDGGRAYLLLRLRPLAPLELEPQISQAWFRQGGQQAYREQVAQLLSVWHLDARRSLRAIAQHGSGLRDGQRLWADGSLSLTYAWRPTSGSVLYLGASRGRQGEQPRRSSEAFVKLQLDVDDWRSGAIRW
jgi:hypothetical protein